MSEVKPEFCKITSFKPVAAYLAKNIAQHLKKGHRVLWLLSGGSSINIATEAAKLLKDEKLDNLTVTLADERFGPVGHPDSNWAQLMQAGLSLPGAKLQSVLRGSNIVKTTEGFGFFLEKELKKADYRIGLIGVGADGHTFGILPSSPAVAATRLVIYYQGHDFLRITPTVRFIPHLDEVVVYAVGKVKRKQIDGLKKSLPINSQPAQALKLAKKLVIFNDQIGEET